MRGAIQATRSSSRRRPSSAARPRVEVRDERPVGRRRAHRLDEGLVEGVALVDQLLVEEPLLEEGMLAEKTLAEAVDGGDGGPVEAEQGFGQRLPGALVEDPALL